MDVHNNKNVWMKQIMKNKVTTNSKLVNNHDKQNIM